MPFRSPDIVRAAVPDDTLLPFFFAMTTASRDLLRALLTRPLRDRRLEPALRRELFRAIGLFPMPLTPGGRPPPRDPANEACDNPLLLLLLPLLLSPDA